MVAVKQPEKAEGFYDFLGEYTEFFAQMEQFEQHKLTILLGGNLSDIENTISAAQANAKKLENLEQKRIRMQEEAGLGALTLSQLADDAGGERKTQLHRQLQRLTSHVYNIRFYNQKAMEVAAGNLRRTGAATAEPAVYGSHGQSAPEPPRAPRLVTKA